MAIASIASYGIVLGGWSSGSNRTPCWAGCASSAQMISYEVAMGLALVAGLPARRLDVDLGES